MGNMQRGQKEKSMSVERSVATRTFLVINKLPTFIHLLKQEIKRHPPHSTLAVMYKKDLEELKEVYYDSTKK